MRCTSHFTVFCCARALAHLLLLTHDEQVVDRFEAVCEECVGGVAKLSESMHARIAALLRLEDARLSRMAAVLDKLAYAGEAVVAWRASNEAAAAATAAANTHREHSSLRNAAVKEKVIARAASTAKVRTCCCCCCCCRRGSGGGGGVAEATLVFSSLPLGGHVDHTSGPTNQPNPTQPTDRPTDRPTTLC